MRRRFVQIVDKDELERALADIVEWGYPRHLVEGELEHSVFLGFGADLLFWLNNHGTGLNWHIVINPKMRGRYTAEEVDRYFHGLETIAELLGADHLQAILRPEWRALRNYCARRGWRENDEGYIRLLED